MVYFWLCLEVQMPFSISLCDEIGSELSSKLGYVSQNTMIAKFTTGHKRRAQLHLFQSATTYTTLRLSQIVIVLWWEWHQSTVKIALYESLISSYIFWLSALMSRELIPRRLECKMVWKYVKLELPLYYPHWNITSTNFAEISVYTEIKTFSCLSVTWLSWNGRYVNDFEMTP